MRQIRASFTDTTIRVYQAYCDDIADTAIRAQAFVPPFKLDRTTWIKPSFLWMMYRSGWATKPGQQRILAVDIDRSGFDWALAHSCLTHYDPAVYASHNEWCEKKASTPVLVQFDPDRDPDHKPLSWRAIQVGLSGAAAAKYANQWIAQITDITHFSLDLSELVRAGRRDAYNPSLPTESLYPVPLYIAKSIGINASVG